jgi:hypothetical protein
MTYIYVKKDLTFIQDPASQSLLKAFLKAVYSDEYIPQCEEQFGFVRVGGGLRDMALASIDALVTDPTAPEWTFETDTEKRIGQGDYVISQKRKSYSEIEQEKLVEMIGKLSVAVANLEQENAMLKDSLVGQPVSGASKVTVPIPPTTTESSSNAFTMINEDMSEDTQVKTALILSSISMGLWVAAILGLIAKAASGSGSSRGGVEKSPIDMESGVVN